MVRVYLAAMAVLFASSASAQTIEVQILPERPYVEQTEFGQALNFDVLLQNHSDHAVELTELSVTFVDANGRDILTRRLDGNGTAPSIQTLPTRTIAAGGEQLLFNPFEYAPTGARVASVRVAATLSTDEAADVVVAMNASLRGAAGLSYLAPVTGRVLVWDGHDLLSHHRRWDYFLPPIRAFGFVSNAMRYAYDFVPVDAAGQMHTGDGTLNEDWFGFGAPVRAPADGVVVEVRDDRPDDRSFDPSDLAQNINAVFGNYVVIDHGDGSFSMLGHIRQGSATVALGQRVTAGQAIASIGASGSSLFPHLHYQRVDAADMRGEGIPSTFRNVTLVRGGPPINGHIDSGDVIEAR